MMDLIVTIGTYTLIVAWYWVLAAIIVSVSTAASVYHRKYTPVVWGWGLTGILYFGASYLEPVLFGWMGYQHSNVYMFYLSLAMAVMFFIQVGLLLANSIKYGEVWA